MKTTSIQSAGSRVSRLSLMAVALGSAVWLAGCGSTVKLNETKPAEAPAPAAAPTTTGASTQPATAVAPVVAELPDASQALASLPTAIYFDFDSFVVKSEFQPTIEGYARVLTQHPSKRLVVEGHTDERGGREYNLALGQKRAEATVRALSLLGVTAGQLEAVSFGEERPAVEGGDEEAWAKNRRAEFKGR